MGQKRVRRFYQLISERIIFQLHYLREPSQQRLEKKNDCIRRKKRIRFHQNNVKGAHVRNFHGLNPRIKLRIDSRFIKQLLLIFELKEMTRRKEIRLWCEEDR